MSKTPSRRPSMRLAALVVCLAAPFAWADAVSVSLEPKAQVGKGLPSVNVHIQEPIAGFWLKLKRSDGALVSTKGGGSPGQTRVLELAQPVGKFGYQGELEVKFQDGETSSMPLQFEAELTGSVQMTLRKEDVDLERRRIVFRLSRPAQKAHVKVLLESGRYAMDGDVPLHGAAAGSPLEVTWPEVAGKVAKISIRAYDVSGYSDGQELVPWFMDVPHDDINFDTGKAEIRPDQKPMLEETYQKIAQGIDKWGEFADVKLVKLYIVAHTDSVGSKESNRTLSLQRAKAIGQYLRRRGVTIGIFYEGFGEESLKVRTPDETDEPRNRRAQYILSGDLPTLENAPFRPSFRKL